MKHEITVRADGVKIGPWRPFLTKILRGALDALGVSAPCSIDVLLTGDAGIQEINRDQRGVDKPTDVLSFPAFEFLPGELPDGAQAEPGSGLVPLGDMAFSLERVAAQAEEFGHSTEREAAYLAVHSLLHLLGYDHTDEGPDKAVMRGMEKTVLGQLGFAGEEL